MIDYESIGIGEVIENLRRRRRMTQEQLAEGADLDRNTIGRIERDETIPSFSTILNIALALNVTPIQFSAELEKRTNILEYYQQKDKG